MGGDGTGSTRLMGDWVVVVVGRATGAAMGAGAVAVPTHRVLPTDGFVTPQTQNGCTQHVVPSGESLETNPMQSLSTLQARTTGMVPGGWFWYAGETGEGQV
jgi:hypothetical protein